MLIHVIIMSKPKTENAALNYYVTVKNDRDKLVTFSTNSALKYALFKEDENGTTQGILQFKERKRPHQVKAFLNVFGIQDITVEKHRAITSTCKELKDRSGVTIEEGSVTTTAHETDSTYNYDKPLKLETAPLPPVKDITSSIQHDSRNYVINTVKQIKAPKFGWTDSTYQFQFHDPEGEIDFVKEAQRIHEMFDEFVTNVTKDMNEDDQIRFIVRSPQLDSPISRPFMMVKDFTYESILGEIEKVIQSNQEFTLTDDLRINVVHIQPPKEFKRKRFGRKRNRFSAPPRTLQEALTMAKFPPKPKVPKMDMMTPSTNHFAEDEHFGRNSDEEGLSQEV